jgi:hypothetical protein
MFESLIRIIRRQWLLLLLIAYTVVLILGAYALVIASAGSEAYNAESFAFFFMIEIAILLFVIPLLAVVRIDSEMRSATIAQFVSAQMSPGRIAIRVFGYPLLIAIILCLIPGSMALIIRKFFGGIPAIDIILASLLMLTIAAFALSLGFYCSVICRTAFSGAGLALLILVLVCTEPIWFAPIINLAPDTPVLIQSTLLINPFVGVASALKFDILRTNPLYHICPIGQLRFQYPSCWSIASYNLLLALVIFWRSAVSIRRMVVPSA